MLVARALQLVGEWLRKDSKTALGAIGIIDPFKKVIVMLRGARLSLGIMLDSHLPKRVSMLPAPCLALFRGQEAIMAFPEALIIKRARSQTFRFAPGRLNHVPRGLILEGYPIYVCFLQQGGRHAELLRWRPHE